jgi:hypothetical protein
LVALVVAPTTLPTLSPVVAVEAVATTVVVVVVLTPTAQE